MTKIIARISFLITVLTLSAVIFATAAIAAMVDFSEVTAPAKAYLACETIEKDPTDYKVGETITFRIEFRSGNDLISVPKFDYSISAEDDTAKSGTVSGENGYFEVSTTISKPGVVRIIATPRNEDGTELKNGTSSYRMVGGACANIEDIEMVMAEPDDFDEYWAACIDELYTVFPNILKIEKDTDNSDSRYDVYRIYFDCVGKKEFLNTAAAGEEPNGDTYVAAKLTIDKEIAPGEAKFSLTYQGAGVYTSPGVSKKEGYVTLCVFAHSILMDQEDSYYTELKSGILPENYLRRQKYNDDSDMSYKKYIFLRDLQAVRFLKEFFGENGGGQGTVDGVDTSAWAGLWNGLDIEVTGSSQGGWQSLAVAALDHDVTKMTANVPGMSDIYANHYEPGRDNYDSGYYHYSQKYFDGASLAKRIVCDSYIRTGFGDEQCPASIVICVYNALSCSKELKIWQCMPHGQSKTYADGTAKPSWTFSENFSLRYSDSFTFDWDISAIEGTAISLGADGKTITAESIGSATVSFANGRPSITVEVIPSKLNIAIVEGISGDLSEFENGLNIAFSNRRSEMIRVANGWDDFASDISAGNYIKGDIYYFYANDGTNIAATRTASAAALLGSFKESGAEYCAMIADPSLNVTSAAMYAMQMSPEVYPDMYVVGQRSDDVSAMGRAAANAILSTIDANQPYDGNSYDVYNTDTGSKLRGNIMVDSGEKLPIAIVPSMPYSVRDGIIYKLSGLEESDLFVIDVDSDGGSFTVDADEYIIYPGGIASGEEENYSFILGNDGVLSIMGSKLTGNFAYLDYADKITEINIAEGITEISSGAFASLTALMKVTLPHSLESISTEGLGGAGFELFIYENNTAAAGFAEEIGIEYTSMGLSFDAGENLLAVLKDGTLTITGSGKTVNSGCTAGYGTWTKSVWYDYYNQITSVVIKAPVTTIAGGCFTYMTKLTTVEIPDTLTKIEGHGFGFCYNLKTIFISGSEKVEGAFDLSNVTSIGTYAFTICRVFDKLILSENLKNISDYAFSSNSALSIVEIPEGVTYIGTSAFSHTQSNAPGVKTVFIKGSPEIGGASTFKDIEGTKIFCASEYTYNILKSYDYQYAEVIFVDGFIDYGIEDGFFWTIDKNYKLSVLSSGYISFVDCPWTEHLGTIKSISVENGALTIGSGVFAGLTALEKAELPSTITSVAVDAFSGSQNFTLYAYEDSTIDELVENNDNINYVSLGAFGYAGENLQWKYSDGVLEIFGTGTTVNPGTGGYGTWVNSTFYKYYKNITKVIIGPSVTTVYNDAFANMDSLLTVEIPAGLTKLGTEAFAYCDKLLTIYISGNEPVVGTFDLSNITSLSSYALHSCTAVKNIILGDIATINAHAFSKCTALETVTVNNTNAVNVKENAFYESKVINQNMKAVTFTGPMTATATSFTDVAMNIYVASAEDAEIFNELGYTNARAIYLTGSGSAVTHEGFSVRIADYNGLRSFFKFDKNIAAANKNGGNTLVELGVIVASKANYDTYGAELSASGNEYVTPDSKIVKKAVYKGEKQVGSILGEDSSAIEFALTVTNFTNNYTSDIYFCAYEIWQSASGEISIFYTDCEDDDYDCTNIYEISINMYKNGLVNAENDNEDIVWDLLSEAGAVTLTAGTDYTLTEGITDLDGNAFGEKFTFRDVIAVKQSSSTSTKLLTFSKGDVTITLLHDPEGGYIAVYRPIGETGTVPSVASSAYNGGRGNQLHSNFGSNYTHNSTSYTVQTARPNPTLSSDVYKNIHTVIMDYGIKSIGQGAFTNNGYTKTYIYPTTLATLSSHTFYASTGITTMFMADPLNSSSFEVGLVDLSGISSVGTSYLFTTGINIVKLHLPGTLTSISDSFISVGSKTTSALQKVWCGDTAEPDAGIIDLSGAKIASIKGAAFRGAKNISTLILPDSCTSITSTAFNGSNGGSEKNSIMSSFIAIRQSTKVDAIATYCGTSISYTDLKGTAH